MNSLTRRSFVSRVAAGLAALSVVGEGIQAAHAQLVWKSSQWKLADFQKLAADPASVKQVVEAKQINDGVFLNSIKNSLNGLSFGFGVPKEKIKIVAALHGPANMINFDDFIWNKYRIGEWLKVTDDATGKPAVRNIFYPATHPLDAASYAKDPSDRDSAYQDTSVEALQARGVQFLSCHTASEEQARGLIARDKLTQQPEKVVEELLAHTVPGVLVVASMVAAIALLQAQGHYTYLAV
jgi:intracellular sulfur oxidation DsrE/DsrF family protein